MAIRRLTEAEKIEKAKFDKILKDEGLGVISPSREAYSPKPKDGDPEREPKDFPESFLTRYQSVYHSYNSWEEPWHSELMYAVVCEGRLPKELVGTFPFSERAIRRIIDRYVKHFKKILCSNAI